ncbi:hypothetical protein M427DRAFT_332152 [Gonapodya prolifera JEL478]|uniref:SH3 domain-containing protein n=1 Tax=Gonapodya prolifera (strain JEL478) TaxID=1344416 RepID=A0A139ADQ1_GONPJ|nr:hypothetical protein M427DRAFT_332152 [Gonapodya prolifera JEL478]|eukprot:KXS14921.1 hypothetical protein M427DRAFT_332152 [Gonapodya prolifera JEL478]
MARKMLLLPSPASFVVLFGMGLLSAFTADAATVGRFHPSGLGTVLTSRTPFGHAELRGPYNDGLSTPHHLAKRLTGDCITPSLTSCGNGSSQFCMPATGAQCCSDAALAWWCPTGSSCGVGGACVNCLQLCSGRCISQTTFSNSYADCGGCGNTCADPVGGAGYCSQGKCNFACKSGYTLNNNVCVVGSSGSSSPPPAASGSPPAASTSNGSGSPSNNIGLIAGIAGGVAAVAVLSALAIFFYRRNQKSKAPAGDTKPPVAVTTSTGPGSSTPVVYVTIQQPQPNTTYSVVPASQVTDLTYSTAPPLNAVPPATVSRPTVYDERSLPSASQVYSAGTGSAPQAYSGQVMSQALSDISGLTAVNPSGVFQPHWFFTAVATAQGTEEDHSLSYNGPPLPVAVAYQATTDDEITLSPTQLVEVKTLYRDGWAVGVNLATQTYGFFPIDCLRLDSNLAGNGSVSFPHSSYLGGNSTTSSFLPRHESAFLSTRSHFLHYGGQSLVIPSHSPLSDVRGPLPGDDIGKTGPSREGTGLSAPKSEGMEPTKPPTRIETGVSEAKSDEKAGSARTGTGLFEAKAERRETVLPPARVATGLSDAKSSDPNTSIVPSNAGIEASEIKDGRAEEKKTTEAEPVKALPSTSAAPDATAY